MTAETNRPQVSFGMQVFNGLLHLRNRRVKPNDPPRCPFDAKCTSLITTNISPQSGFSEIMAACFVTCQMQQADTTEEEIAKLLSSVDQRELKRLGGLLIKTVLMGGTNYINQITPFLPILIPWLMFSVETTPTQCGDKVGDHTVYCSDV